MQKAKAPTKGLSELNSMAFELAVYASWSELPQYHARFASGCWSGSTGRDSTRKVPMKGFKVVDYISFPFPKLTWRNCIDFGSLRSTVTRVGEIDLCVLGMP